MHARRLGGTSRISAVIATPSSAGTASPSGARLWFGSGEGVLYSLDLPRNADGA
jgi:hypothetical protein